MVDGLDRLRHHRIVGCDNDDGKVSKLGATGTHGRKRLMARRVQERYTASVRQFDIVRTYMLGDTTGLTGDHI